MRLAVFLHEYRESEILNRLKAEKLGIILVQNGVYHATIKKEGKLSSILDKEAEFYVLLEDIKARGLSEDKVTPKVKIINFEGLVDIIFNDYEKFIWL